MAQHSTLSGIQQQIQNISLFPPPPIYAEQYTAENVKKGHVLPPPPLPIKFEVFAEPYDLDGPLMPTLSDLGCQQLYSGSGNWRAELKKLNRSLVAAFLDLIEMLIKCPDHADRLEKIDTIRNLLINIHHLINEYRPVQARDTLRQMILHQNQEIINVTEQLDKLTEMGSTALDALNVALQKFSVGDYSIPEMPRSCMGNSIMEGIGEDLSPMQFESDLPVTVEDIQSLKPIELPAHIVRKDIPGVKMHLQKEFSKQK